mmetsp:Transcript_2979/g.12057  ORF Transcript_2979/g.12057 Transcript_2979/m.12057 type:complete len:206 (-) Transcript_2979:43-660(-)
MSRSPLNTNHTTTTQFLELLCRLPFHDVAQVRPNCATPRFLCAPPRRPSPKLRSSSLGSWCTKAPFAAGPPYADRNALLPASRPGQVTITVALPSATASLASLPKSCAVAVSYSISAATTTSALGRRSHPLRSSSRVENSLGRSPPKLSSTDLLTSSKAKGFTSVACTDLAPLRRATRDGNPGPQPSSRTACPCRSIFERHSAAT